MTSRIAHVLHLGLMTLALYVCSGTSLAAAPIFWTDWSGANSGATSAPFTANGTITTPTSTVSVTYVNPQGVGFYQATGGSDWWVDSSLVRDPATSPYTSAVVDNIPTGVDMIALDHAGSQTLTFSQTIANPVFSFISLNGNGYAFLNQDFDILSVGTGSPTDHCGYWGCGSVTKNIVPVVGGTEYQLIGSGEPHGTIQFRGSFDTLTWRSLSNEYWNGITVGVQGTAQEVFPTIPEPGTLLLVGSALAGGVARARQRRKRSS